MDGGIEMLKGMYDRFNARDVDGILAVLADDVAWANGMDGGHVHGRETVRDTGRVSGRRSVRTSNLWASPKRRTVRSSRRFDRRSVISKASRYRVKRMG